MYSITGIYLGYPACAFLSKTLSFQPPLDVALLFWPSLLELGALELYGTYTTLLSCNLPLVSDTPTASTMPTLSSLRPCIIDTDTYLSRLMHGFARLPMFPRAIYVLTGHIPMIPPLVPSVDFPAHSHSPDAPSSRKVYPKARGY
jgi:hypothetical protein